MYLYTNSVSGQDRPESAQHRAQRAFHQSKDLCTQTHSDTLTVQTETFSYAELGRQWDAPSPQ